MNRRKERQVRRLARTVIVAGILGLAIGASWHTGCTVSPAEAAPVHQAAASVTPVSTDQLVVVVDNTHGHWLGIRKAAHAWSASSHVDLQVRKHCAPSAYCVYVTAYAYGDTGWMAQTRRLDDHSAHVEVNTAPAYASLTSTWAQQAGIMCHELGHALGVDHPDGTEPAGTRGCIAAPDPANTTTLASPADLGKLDAVAAGHGTQGWGALAGDAR